MNRGGEGDKGKTAGCLVEIWSPEKGGKERERFTIIPHEEPYREVGGDEEFLVRGAGPPSCTKQAVVAPNELAELGVVGEASEKVLKLARGQFGG